MIGSWTDTHVSRETFDKLEQYVDLLRKWNKSINLVSRNDVDHIWSRHIDDCSQIIDIASELLADPWLDVGSGGGLPGIVVGILKASEERNTLTTLVESDSRKCAFLHHASKKLDLNITVQNTRVERISGTTHKTISARALAPVDQILNMTEHCTGPQTKYLLFKGRSWKDEIEQAKTKWSFDVVAHPSVTNKEAAILRLLNVQRH